MKIYNPITGETINTKQFVFHPDTYKEFSNDFGQKLLEKYSFLIDSEDKRMKPPEDKKVGFFKRFLRL